MDKIKAWAKKKLDDGVDEQRVRKVLRRQGHDPSIVDELKDPFDPKDSEDKEVTDNFFEDEEDDSGEEHPREKSIHQKDDEENGFHRNSLDEESSKTGHGDKDSGSSSGIKSNIPRPDFGKPKLSKDRYLKFGALGLVLVLVVGAGAVFGSDITNTVSELTEPKDYTGCQNGGVGVLIQDIRKDGQTTVADVKVVRNKSETVLKIYQDDRKIGETRATFIGEKTLSVDAVGNKARFHPVGCQRYVSTRNY